MVIQSVYKDCVKICTPFAWPAVVDSAVTSCEMFTESVELTRLARTGLGQWRGFRIDTVFFSSDREE